MELTTQTDLPEIIYKGIPSNNEIDGDSNIPKPGLFTFSLNIKRETPCFENSIIWCIDDTSLDLLFKIEKNSRIQFRSGASIILKSSLDQYLETNPNLQTFFSYELLPNKDHPHHGNFILHIDTPDVIRKAVRGVLQLYTLEPEPNPYYSSP